MNVKTYQKAKRYARKIKYNDPIDLVHDSYLKWYEKTGQDLFDEPDGRVMSILWKECNNHIRRGKWMYEGVRYSKIYTTFSEGHLLDDMIPADKYSSITPEDHCIANDLKARFIKTMDTADTITKEILRYKYLGYQGKEISEEMNISQTAVSVRIKQANLDGIRDI